MAGFPVRQYKPGGEFVAVRDMDFGPRHFKAGEIFPWREMGVHEATVQMLWKAVLLEVKRDAPTAAVPSKPAAADALSEAELERLTAPAPRPAAKPVPANKPQQPARR